MRALAMALVATVLSFAGPSGSHRAHASGAPSFSTATVTLITGPDARRTMTVEVARTHHQRRWGLMFRENLDRNRGMLFLYNREQRVSMWMKNTLIPLDMIFIDRQGRVVEIYEGAQPGSERVIRSAEPVKAVLEVNAGAADRLGIDAGDRVRFHAFTSTH